MQGRLSRRAIALGLLLSVAYLSTSTARVSPAGAHGANNTFHINGQPFGNSTSFSAAGVLQAETLAQAAERGGKKVVQIEWAGGRVGAINGPTIDFRSFLSGRGVATNYISPDDLPDFVTSFGLQFDHPAGFADQPPFAEAAPTPATGWTNVPRSYSPAMQMRLRVLDFGIDRYGLNAYIYDSTNDGVTNYDRVFFSKSKDGADRVGNLALGAWADVKVTIVDGALAGKTAGFLIKVEALTPDLSQVRLFHTSVTRAQRQLARLAWRARFHRHFRRIRGPEVPDVDGIRFRCAGSGRRQ